IGETRGVGHVYHLTAHQTASTNFIQPRRAAACGQQYYTTQDIAHCFPLPILPLMQTVYVDGAAIVYRLYDVAYTLDLEHAARLLAPSGSERVRPLRTEAQALQIKNLPVDAQLGSHRITIGNIESVARISVRLFDFGVCSLRAEMPAPRGITWQEYSVF